MHILTDEYMFEAAWQASSRHSVSPHAKEALARASEASHPRKALAVYAERVDQLARAGGPSYQEAVKLIERMAAMRGPAEHADYLADVKIRFKAKRNFMKLLG